MTENLISLAAVVPIDRFSNLINSISVNYVEYALSVFIVVLPLFYSLLS